MPSDLVGVKGKVRGHLDSYPPPWETLMPENLSGSLAPANPSRDSYAKVLEGGGSKLQKWSFLFSFWHKSLAGKSNPPGSVDLGGRPSPSTTRGTTPISCALFGDAEEEGPARPSGHFARVDRLQNVLHRETECNVCSYHFGVETQSHGWKGDERIHNTAVCLFFAFVSEQKRKQLLFANGHFSCCWFLKPTFARFLVSITHQPCGS